MRARQRHINPKAAGANLVLDSRYITGLSDGTGVSTWSDISGNGYDATQATAANQPLFKVNVQGGQPGLLFDGSNDSLATSYGPQSGNVTAFAVWKATSPGTTLYRRIMDKDYINAMWMGKDGPSAQSYGGGALQANLPYGTYVTLDNTNTHLLSASRSGTSWTITSESQTTATATVSSTAFNNSIIRIGLGNNNGDPWNGHIFGFLYFHNLALSSSMLKRIFRSYGFAFKIACS
jgi:hypothetical protein